ncbi:MAG: hypothetical protein RMK97_04560 [Sutterellaceae bacterium]|nr:hypothetical protein [Burkholderiaceae bacterium]MDW8429764.1 hypothetical protein [Sutterellaceae bacterium]
MTADLYSAGVNNPSGNPALTSQSSGTRQRVVLQSEFVAGDPKSPSSFARMMGTVTDDRTLQPRYREMLNHLQIGFGGAGWLLACGDVVGAYSPLAINVGLRGLSGAVAGERWTLALAGGMLAESWEALAKRSTLTGQPARTAFLREVTAGQFSFRPAQPWTLSVTGVRYRDRPDSAQVFPGVPVLSGSSASVRLAYSGA